MPTFLSPLRSHLSPSLANSHPRKVLGFALLTFANLASAASFIYSGPAVPIPDGADLSGNNPGTPVEAPITVSGLTRAIANVTLSIDGQTCTSALGATTVGIDHSFAEDLRISLRSPNGTSVVLISRTGGSGNHFCQVVLDDDSTGPSIQTVTSSQAPFTGSYTPNAPLSAFAGEMANGTWALVAQDIFLQDTGSIRAWTLNITEEVAGALANTTPALPGGTVGVAYSASLTATGGTQPYVWSATNLPPGLAISNGVLSGTPTQAGSFNVSLNLSDSAATAQTALAQAHTMVIAAAPVAPAITTGTLPDATEGQTYSQALQVTGGTAPYTWAVVSGSLPPGLTLDPATGVLSGTVAKVAQATKATGTFSFGVQVTDSSSPQQLQSTVQPLSLQVIAAVPATVTPVPTLGAWALALLGLLTAGLGLRRREG